MTVPEMPAAPEAATAADLITLHADAEPARLTARPALLSRSPTPNPRACSGSRRVQ
jgi:hypothetical protein